MPKYHLHITLIYKTSLEISPGHQNIYRIKISAGYPIGIKNSPKFTTYFHYLTSHLPLSPLSPKSASPYLCKWYHHLYFHLNFDQPSIIGTENSPGISFVFLKSLISFSSFQPLVLKRPSLSFN